MSDYNLRKHLLTMLTLLVFGQRLFAQAELPENVEGSIIKRVEYGVNPSIAIGIIDGAGTHHFNFGTDRSGGNPVDQHTSNDAGIGGPVVDFPPRDVRHRRNDEKDQ